MQVHLLDDFTVCVLGYGDYPDLIQRTVGSVLRCAGVCDSGWVALGNRLNLRIGLNSPGKQTLDFCKFLVDKGYLKLVNLYVSSDNIAKYPMMRRMFHDSDNRITTPLTMWFDDDSWCTGEADTQARWFNTVRLNLHDADMIGSIYKIRLAHKQHEWICAQPWYRANPPVHANQVIRFVTGGWWTIKTSTIHLIDWPIPQLHHRGGDVLLSIVLQQHGLSLRHFRSGVAINAHAKTGIESTSPRRGIDETPIGYNGVDE